MGYHHIYFFAPPIQISCLRCDYYVWNRLETLKTRLFPLAKNGRNTNWFGLVYFHNHIKWDDICHYDWKFKIAKERWIMYSAEKKTKFHFRSGRGSPLIVAIYTLSSCTHNLWKVFVNVIFFLYPKKLDHRKIYQAYHIFFLVVQFYHKKKLSVVALIFVFQNNYKRLHLNQITILKKNKTHALIQ